MRKRWIRIGLVAMLATVPGRLDAQGDSAAGQTLLLDASVGRHRGGLITAREEGAVIVVRLGDLLRLAGYAASPEADSLWLPATDAAARLGSELSVDLRNGTLHLAARPDFPVVVAAERARHRADLLARQALERAPLVLMENADGESVAVDYRVNWLGTAIDRSDALFRVSTPVAGGVSQVEVDRSAAGTELRPSWSVFRPEGRLLTRLDAGHVRSPSRWSVPTVGFALSNVPLFRPLVVDHLAIGGSLPHGWNIDAYRDGRLVAFDSATAGGRYSMVLPIQYGENPLQFVAQGPSGEIRRFEQLFRVVPTLLPDGAFEYNLSAGWCEDADRCGSAAVADLRYGAGRRLTIGGGLLQRDGASGGLLRPQFMLVAQPVNELLLDGEIVPGLFTRLALGFESGPDFRLTVEGTVHSPDMSRLGLASEAGTRTAMATGRWRLGRGAAAPALELGARITDLSGDGRTLNEGRIGGVLLLGAMVARPYLRWQPSDGGTATSPGLELTMLPRNIRGFPVDRGWFRGTLETDGGGSVRQASIAGIAEIGWRFRLEAGGRWDRSTGRFTAQVGVQWWLPASRVSATAMSGGGVAQTARGSMIWDRRSGSLRATADPVSDRSGIAVTAFLDDNNDGARQPDEPPVTGAVVIAGGRILTTGADGTAELWGVPPWAPVEVMLDSASLADPAWVPATPGYRVVPRAARMSHVMLPVVAGRIIEGRVELPADLESRFAGSALPLELVSADGRVVRKFETFADRTFYLEKVHPGSYRIRLSPDFSASLDLPHRSIEVTVAGPGDPRVVTLRIGNFEEVAVGGG